MRKAILIANFCLCYFVWSYMNAQVSYGSVATYGLRKIIPTYISNAIQVRRSCDNATVNIGFTSCGDLDTVSLKNFVLVPNPLSAIAPAASAAYSLRRLSCAYVGNAIQVRRSSDNATQDIGFTALGDLDTATMKTFVGAANNGFISIWYDQSGNGRNATQATAANQPRIITAGAVLRQNNKPAIRFSGSPILLTAAALTGVNSTSGGGNVTTSNIVFQSDNAVAGTIFSNGDGGTNRYNIHTPWSDNNTYFDIGNIAAGGRINTGLTWSSLSIGSFRRSGAQGDVWKNGTNSLTSGAMATNCTSALAMSIGGSAAYGSYMTGYISELIVFPSALTTTERQYLEWSQSIYYNIAGPVLTTLPASPASASVATWYDQSGTGANASPTITTNQPLIVSAGIVQRNNTTTPAIKFNGAQKGLVANLPVSSYPVTISAFAKTSGAATNGAFVKLGGVDNLNNATSGIGIGVGANGGNFDPPTGTSLIGLKEWIIWCPSSPAVNYPATGFAVEVMQLAAGTMSAFLNGAVVPLSNSATAVGASITGSLYIGGYRNSTDRYPVFNEAEVTIFNSSLNNTRRILLETNQSAYFGNAISANKYTPPSATTYNRYVLGIGREAAADNVTDTQQSAGMGFTVGATASDYLKDNGDYMTAGINCPITNTTSVLNLPATVLVRWDNDWYVVKTDVSSNNGTLSFYFDFSDYNIPTLPGVAANYRLLNRPNTASNFTIVPGTTPSVSGDRVYFSVDASNIVTNSYFTIGSTNPVNSPLPIQLLNFEAKVCEQDVCLNWSTANEINNDRFVIQRSNDANDWMDIKSIKGSSNSQRTLNYESIDTEPLKGLSYYRLKQVDLNGDFSYSIIRSVEFKNLEGISIYPNPTNGVLNINHCGVYEKIYITNALGQTNLIIDITKENVKLDLNQLPSGDYFVTLINTTNQKKYTSKIILNKTK